MSDQDDVRTGNTGLPAITLPLGRWPATPAKVGWYICYSGITTPRLAYWGAFSDVFRLGAQAIPVDTYAGPIPERKVRS